MSDTEDAKTAAANAQKALEAIGTALTEMNAAKTKVAIDAAHATVAPQVQIAETQSFAAFAAAGKANTVEADDAADRARDCMLKARSAAADAQTLLDKRRPTLP